MNSRRRQGGVVALELALSLPVLLSMLVVLTFYGRVMYNYEVVQKAAWAGARYLSSVPAVNMKNPQLAAQEVALASHLIEQELGALAPAPGNLIVAVTCDGVPCSALFNYVPAMVTVVVMIEVPSGLSDYAGNLGNIRVRASHNVRYVGN
ncbi:MULTISPECIES: TadE/TadG family type IV pilus assembly protein [unclassified Duganella]|jgi:Flp pilus assembly protein TadG|uniref:TadE/TadG family type IV pilus assembly protein n=1 Tax=unclassified Duganella TaxID=2636909 RepID=UPI00088E919D|nr:MULTISPECIES: TadE/TadG family type IV pilus assembly protein [unclassified Duganella]SDF42447.1 TadE-like protein [Duganella sp. OV458]SDI84101.1 TadE-like protein [Duganella sp. OV510]